MLKTFPQCNFQLEFPERLSQNLICCHWLSLSGNSKTMHCGILINMTYSYYMVIWLWLFSEWYALAFIDTCISNIKQINHFITQIQESWKYSTLMETINPLGWQQNKQITTKANNEVLAEAHNTKQCMSWHTF